MKKIVLLLALCAMVFSNALMAQDQNQNPDKPPFKDKVFFGGGIGAGFGTYTFISVSPIIGYRLTPRLSPGIRLMYQYTTFKYYDFIDQKEETYSGNDFGIGGFVTYSLFGPVFLQAEYEHLSYDGLDYSGNQERASFDSFMAGGGISQPMGRKAAFFLAVLYNFSYENFNNTNAYRSPYNSPWVVRLGVTGGF
jgi:hypothetical protein